MERWCNMFWLGFLFGDENRQLKEIERSRKQREFEEREKKAAFMVEDFEPFLTTMDKEGLTETSVVFSDCSRFDYAALPKVLSKLGSKIAYTRLEKEKGTFTLTLYKNRPEAISRLYLVILLRGLLWLVVALMTSVLVFGVLSLSLELVKSQFTSSFLMPILLNFLVVFFVITSSNAIASVLFRYSKVSKEFVHTVRFDKVLDYD